MNIDKTKILSEWFQAYLENDTERYWKLESILMRIEQIEKAGKN